MRKTLVAIFFLAAAGAAAVLLLASLGPGATAQAPAGLEPAPVALEPLPVALEPVPAASPGRPVAQPILFSHKIHAGDVGMDCQYCHIGVDEGPVATLPAVSTCMGCHKMVGLGRPEIEKLKGYADREQPIPWVRVYDLVDHARFDHHRHVKAGIECQACHGPVETMESVALQQPLVMGFCVQCHKSMVNTPATPASLDCATCHR